MPTKWPSLASALLRSQRGCYSAAIGGQATGKQARPILEEVVEKESEEQSLGASKCPG